MSDKEALKENIATVRVLFTLSSAALLSMVGWIFTHFKTIDRFELFLAFSGFVLAFALTTILGTILHKQIHRLKRLP